MKEELYWGKLTWGLFHTIAEQIQEPKELNNIKKLVEVICQHLPCPHCRDHAKIYLKRKTLDKYVKTRNDLKMYLYEFHNVVNVRTKKKIQPTQILEQYSKVNLLNLLNIWVKYFKIFKITPYTIKEHSDREKIKVDVYKYVNNYLSKLKSAK